MAHTTRYPIPTRSSRWRRFAAPAAVVLALALVAVACGDDGGSAGASGASGARSVTIASPTAGSQVGTTFEVQLTPSFDIGEPDTGRPHVHLHFDGSSEYTIVYDRAHTITDLAPGMHTVVAVVANPDHSETDVRSPEVSFEVTDQATSPQPANPQPAATTAPRSNGGVGGY
jgi:hypothetical protein